MLIQICDTQHFNEFSPISKGSFYVTVSFPRDPNNEQNYLNYLVITTEYWLSFYKLS